MKQTLEKQTDLLDSRQTLNLYLETLFQENTTEQDAIIKKQIEIKQTKIKQTKIKIKQKKDMEIMLINFGKHKLAMSVMDLKTVVDINEKKLIQLPEQEPYILGVLNHARKNIPVYDLNWVFNSNRTLNKPVKATTLGLFRQAIILHGECMAIACDSADKIINIKNDSVRWSKFRGTHPWLKGIIMENMSVLLGIREIKRLFERGIIDVEIKKRTIPTV